MAYCHALIAGAGVAGPALALALARHGIRSTIFEQRAEGADPGGSITLAPNALRALDGATRVYDRVKAAGFVYSRVQAYTDDGAHYGALLNGEEFEGGYPCVRIMRGDLQRVMLETCAESDLIEVVWQAKLESIEETEAGVTVIFEDGSSKCGDLLFGADGIHSRVRKLILGATAPAARFTGSAILTGFVDKQHIILPPGMSSPCFIISPTGFVGIFPLADGRLAWGITESVAEPSSVDREGWAEWLKSGQAAATVKSHYADIQTEPIKSLVAGMDKRELKLWAPYELEELPRWSRGRVLILGDAAHGLPPNGQGAGQALEDVAYLSRFFGSAPAQSLGHTRIFEQFETTRRQRIAVVAQTGKKAGGMKSSVPPNSWRWFAKRWLIYAFFAKSRWLVSTADLTSYDVMEEPLVIV